MREYQKGDVVRLKVHMPADTVRGVKRMEAGWEFDAGGCLMPSAAFKLPPNGPRDVNVWLALFGLATHDHGAIDPATGEVFVVDPERKLKYPLDLACVDELVRLGWVSDAAGHDELKVTEKGAYWARRFARVNGGL